MPPTRRLQELRLTRRDELLFSPAVTTKLTPRPSSTNGTKRLNDEDQTRLRSGVYSLRHRTALTPAGFEPATLSLEGCRSSALTARIDRNDNLLFACWKRLSNGNSPIRTPNICTSISPRRDALQRRWSGCDLDSRMVSGVAIGRFRPMSALCQ